MRLISFYRHYSYCPILLPLRLLTPFVLQISTDEQSVLIKALDNKDATQASGVRAAGNKYFTLQLTDRSVYGKKGVRGFHSLPSFSLTPITGRWNPCNENETSSARCCLQGPYSSSRSDAGGRRARRLSDQCRVLNFLPFRTLPVNFLLRIC